jgi:hypothetical protein
MKQLILIICLVFTNCCTYIFKTEYKGLVISGGPKSAYVNLTPGLTITINDKNEEDLPRDTTVYQIGTEYAIYEVKYSSSCPLPDSLLKGSNLNKLYELKNRKDVKHFRVYHGDQMCPIAAFDYSIQDTSIVEIVDVHPTLVPYSNFGEIRFKPKKDGITELIAKSKKSNLELKAEITVKNMIVMNTAFPSELFNKTTSGNCKCK